MESSHLKQATFGTGCFWCAEAAFKLLKGVVFVMPGYAGKEHVEVVQIEYDAEKTSYEELLKIFWEIHNPTEKDRQGPDVGPQYQAVIFYHTEEQRRLAEQSKEKLERVLLSVATKILPFKNFYQAEEYHKNYYEKNPETAYSQSIIASKVEKVKKLMRKKEYEQ